MSLVRHCTDLASPNADDHGFANVDGAKMARHPMAANIIRHRLKITFFVADIFFPPTSIRWSNFLTVEQQTLVTN